MARRRTQDVGPARAKTARAQPRSEIARAQYVGGRFASVVSCPATGSDADELNGFQLVWQR
jgi:hypothetical protein